MQAPPQLSDSYPLRDEQIEQFRRDGFAIVPDLVEPAIVEAYTPLIEQAFDRHRGPPRPPEELDAYARAFVQVVNLSHREDSVLPFVRARRFAEVAGRLMGVDGIRIFVEDFFFKPAGGGPTPWHQDGSALPFDTPHMCTMWIPLAPASTAMGTLRFVVGSHRAGLLGPVDISEQTEAWFGEYIAANALEVIETGAVSLGGASFHHGMTIHGAGANETTRDRNAIAIHYFEADAPIRAPDNATRRHLLQMFAPGAKPGDLPDFPAWPVVWRRA